MNAATPSSEPVGPREPVDPADRNGTFRSESLELALAAQDAAAVAFALRHDVVVVPKLVLPADTTDAAPSTGGPDDGALPDEGDQVRVFGRENTDKRILLLFSSAEAYAAMVPDDPDRQVMLYDALSLRVFLEAHLDVIEQVFFDIAGPHTMAAAPEDLLKALR
ncbi:SseB family protein [Frigoribacterium sp. VKM Ac-2836]|uniref:SseB family protein n=1 Tax=Frigoribacterium sp. VKM Ac-2836 TaxID=2739014 RepID=UPI001C25B99C|nr:SseB family protein [Frigoribacterium sp. VKM Ac-2836]NRD26481.1 SseB family protein [Frigoribacterium sp. VKM Ac-2836]